MNASSYSTYVSINDYEERERGRGDEKREREKYHYVIAWSYAVNKTILNLIIYPNV